MSSSYRAPVPLFVPALTAMLVLLVLFGFGVREQDQLARDSVEQLVSQREEIARIVAAGIEEDLRSTEASVARLARDLAEHLDDRAPDADAEFARLFETLTDGSTRSRRQLFDPVTDAGVWIPNYVKLDAGLRAFFVQAKRLIEVYGRGANGQVFVDTWVLPSVSGNVIFWPDEPEYIFQATADFDYRETEWVAGSRPERNPHRRVYWTPLSFDPVPSVWMLSAVAPLYRQGEWFGSVGHDVPLARLLARTELLRQQDGSQFILLTGDDTVAASDQYAALIQQKQGALNLRELPDPLWQQALNQARANQQASRHQRVELGEHVAFVSRINGQNWTLINLIPLTPISDRIGSSFANLRNIALVTLLLEFLIATALLAWSHHRNKQLFAQLDGVQQKLSESERHYRNLVANIPGMVYRCANDPDWTMEFVSASAAELTGYPAEEFLGNGVRSYASIIHPADRERVFDDVQRALDERHSFSLEYRIFHRDDSVRWVLERGRAVYRDDTLLALEGVILDVTPLKMAEAGLRELNSTLETKVEQRTAQLRTAIKELEMFNYAVSHDLRAPVRHVSAYLGMLETELMPVANDAQRELMQRCQRALKRMSEMIAGMLSLAQLGSEGLSPARVDVGAMVRELIQELPATARARVAFDLGDLPVLVADRVLLRQVLHNLIDNAIKYSSGRELARISIRSLPAADAASAASAAKECVLEVRDNGVGFDALHADKLFLLFQRLHSGDAFPGTGVGLAVSAKIVELHGGRIWAESSPGEGASFFVALPLDMQGRGAS